jgi:hypothetical protein
MSDSLALQRRAELADLAMQGVDPETRRAARAQLDAMPESTQEPVCGPPSLEADEALVTCRDRGSPSVRGNHVRRKDAVMTEIDLQALRRQHPDHRAQREAMRADLRAKLDRLRAGYPAHDEKLPAKSPFEPVKTHLKRLAELHAQLAAIHQRANDAVAELRQVETQLARQVAGESYDGAREAELIAERDRCRAAVDPEIHHHRIRTGEGRIRDEIARHDAYVAAHVNELTQALEPERVAAEKAYNEYTTKGAPVLQRVDVVHARLAEIAQYA